VVMGQVIPEWQMVAKKQVSSAELRREYIHSHNVGLHALGLVGYSLLHQHPDDWEKQLQRLSKIDWSRSNVATWEGRAMIGGQMSKARQNVQLTAIFLKKALGMTLSSEETLLEHRARPSNAKRVTSRSTKANRQKHRSQ